MLFYIYIKFLRCRHKQWSKNIVFFHYLFVYNLFILYIFLKWHQVSRYTKYYLSMFVFICNSYFNFWHKRGPYNIYFGNTLF